MEILGHAMQTYNRLIMLQRTFFRNIKEIKRESSRKIKVLKRKFQNRKELKRERESSRKMKVLKKKFSKYERSKERVLER